jgi:ABC-type multidrug transport system ATPase subunit
MLCTEVAFLKGGQLISEGRIPDLQRRLGLGDHLSLIFQESPAPLDYDRLPGVLRHTVQDSRVDLVLDRVDERLPAILEAVYLTEKKLAKVVVKPVDLEEIYHEITH